MFKRSTPTEGFTKEQQQMLRHYEAMGRKLDNDTSDRSELIALDEQPKRRVADFAAALDEYGTPKQHGYFINLHQTIVTSGMSYSLLTTPKDDMTDIRVAICREAIKGWPSVRGFPSFVKMEPALRSQYGDDGYEKGTFIGPEGVNFPVAALIWLCAYGGPTPISALDMSRTMTCVDAFSWLQGAVKNFNDRVNHIMMNTHTHGYR